MKLSISVLLALFTIPVFADEDRNARCECAPIVREGEEIAARLWVAWTESNGKPRNDLIGVFNSKNECSKEALKRPCRFE